MSKHEIKDSLRSVETLVSSMPETNKWPAGKEDSTLKALPLTRLHADIQGVSQNFSFFLPNQIIYGFGNLKKAPWTGIVPMKITDTRLDTAVSQTPTQHCNDANYIFFGC